jgi:hypothetical protein
MTEEEIKTWLLTHAGVESEYNRSLIYNTLKDEFSTAPANKNFILSGVSGSEIRLTANAIELHHGRIKATMLVETETGVIHIMANDKSDVELVDLKKTSCNGGEFHLR